MQAAPSLVSFRRDRAGCNANTGKCRAVSTRCDLRVNLGVEPGEALPGRDLVPQLRYLLSGLAFARFQAPLMPVEHRLSSRGDRLFVGFATREFAHKIM